MSKYGENDKLGQYWNEASGPIAFSDPTYLSSILTNAGFSSINIDTVETSISTKDSVEKNPYF